MPRTTLWRYVNYVHDVTQQEQAESIMDELQERELCNRVCERFRENVFFVSDDVLVMAQDVSGKEGLVNRRITNGVNRTWLYYFIGKYLQDFIDVLGPTEIPQEKRRSGKKCLRDTENETIDLAD